MYEDQFNVNLHKCFLKVVFPLELVEIFSHEGSKREFEQNYIIARWRSCSEKGKSLLIKNSFNSYRAILNGDFLRQLETSFTDTVNKFLLLSKPNCKQECLMILQIPREGTSTILHTLLTCQLQHFTVDWEAIKTITRSLTRAFKTSFETILVRKFALIGILAQRVAWTWTISNFKALSSDFSSLDSSDFWGHSQRQVDNYFKFH